MHLTITNHNYKGMQYRIKAVEDRSGYREHVACAVCKIWHEEEMVNWVDPTTGDYDPEGAPICHSCYGAMFYKLAA